MIGAMMMIQEKVKPKTNVAGPGACGLLLYGDKKILAQVGTS